MSVSRAQDEIDSVEFFEWQQYYDIDPFGLERLDIMLAQIAYYVYNGNIAKRSQAKDLDYFKPDWAKDSKQQTPEEMFAIMKLFTIAAKGKIK